MLIMRDKLPFLMKSVIEMLALNPSVLDSSPSLVQGNDRATIVSQFQIIYLEIIIHTFYKVILQVQYDKVKFKSTELNAEYCKKIFLLNTLFILKKALMDNP